MLVGLQKWRVPVLQDWKVHHSMRHMTLTCHDHIRGAATGGIQSWRVRTVVTPQLEQ